MTRTMDSSAEHRHRCEVRHLIRLAMEQGRERVRAYLDDKRVAGRQAQLRADINAQVKAGNKGEDSVWL